MCPPIDTEPSPLPLSRWERGSSRSPRVASNRNNARSITNTNTPLITWITMLVTLNGHGLPPPAIQFNENVSDASGRCRKLEGDDNAEFTHATSVARPRVIWVAALSTMFG